MPYPTNTVLKRHKPRKVIDHVADPETHAPVEVEIDDPLNVVRIVAPSPIKKPSLAEWEGANGEHYVITAAETFGANHIAPEDVLNRDYEVVTYGEDELPRKIELDAAAHKRRMLETPEQAFARASREAAAGTPPAKSNKTTRVKTVIGESA